MNDMVTVVYAIVTKGVVHRDQVALKDIVRMVEPIPGVAIPCLDTEKAALQIRKLRKLEDGDVKVLKLIQKGGYRDSRSSDPARECDSIPPEAKQASSRHQVDIGSVHRQPPGKRGAGVRRRRGQFFESYGSRQARDFLRANRTYKMGK